MFCAPSIRDRVDTSTGWGVLQLNARPPLVEREGDEGVLGEYGEAALPKLGEELTL